MGGERAAMAERWGAQRQVIKACGLAACFCTLTLALTLASDQVSLMWRLSLSRELEGRAFLHWTSNSILFLYLQGSPVCCSSWGRKESDMILATEQFIWPLQVLIAALGSCVVGMGFSLVVAHGLSCPRLSCLMWYLSYPTRD